VGPAKEDLDLPHWLRRLLMPAFTIAVCVALYSVALRTIAHPHGDGWDAFAIWNLHARFLFLGGANWRNGFSALIPWSHPDYPLLVPSALAHFWTYLSNESSAVPASISFVFTIGTLALLYSSLDQIRGRNSAMMATLALASTPFFIEQGSAQYADVPLSFFFLSTVVLLCLHQRQNSSSIGLAVLAGVAAGFAAWTKNEGLLFLVAALISQVVGAIRRQRHDVELNFDGVHTPVTQWKKLAAFFLGSMPLLLLVLWFKDSVAQPGDLFLSPASMLEKLLSPGRYLAVLSWYFREFFRFGHWWIVPGTVLLAILYLAAGVKGPPGEKPDFYAPTLTLTLTLAGYFVIYLITPYDIYWHLRFSLSRLFLQVWPSVLFLFFTSVSFRVIDNVSK